MNKLCFDQPHVKSDIVSCDPLHFIRIFILFCVACHITFPLISRSFKKHASVIDRGMLFYFSLLYLVPVSATPFT